MQEVGRSPHGERGLKWPGSAGIRFMGKSLPSRGAWIEILIFLLGSIKILVAPLTGSVD